MLLWQFDVCTTKPVDNWALLYIANVDFSVFIATFEANESMTHDRQFEFTVIYSRSREPEQNAGVKHLESSILRRKFQIL